MKVDENQGFIRLCRSPDLGVFAPRMIPDAIGACSLLGTSHGLGVRIDPLAMKVVAHDVEGVEVSSEIPTPAGRVTAAPPPSSGLESAPSVTLCRLGSGSWAPRALPIDWQLP